jgi:hypothetical protein
VPDFDLAPLKDVIRPNGPFGRSTMYRLGAERPGLLRRIEGMRDTFVHLPTLREVQNVAEPAIVRSDLRSAKQDKAA